MSWMLSLFLLLSLLFAACDGYNGDATGIQGAEKGDTVERTLLVYMMAENTLSRPPYRDYAKRDLLEIQSGALELNDNSRLFVYVDNNDTTALPTIYQYSNYNGTLNEKNVFSFETDICSSDTAILGEVLDVLLNNYPTKQFDMILWSHSSGWLRAPEYSAPMRSIGIDNEENNYYSDKVTTTIEIEELAALLERMPIKVDRLLFDACFMQCVEVAYALRNSVNWIIASPAEIPGNGAPYEKVVPAFFSGYDDVDGIMDAYKEDYDNEPYGGVVLSAVKVSEMRSFVEATRPLVEKYLSKGCLNNYDGLFSYLPGGAYYNVPAYPSYYDMNAVMKSLLSLAEYRTWRLSLDKLVPSLKVSDTNMWYSMFVSSQEWKNNLVDVDKEVCCGISMYVPQNTVYCTKFNEDFRTTEWYMAAGFEVAGW